MKGQSELIIEFLQGSKKRYIIPVYQRNYSWKKEQCKLLFNDLVSLVENKKNTHFFGSIVSACHTSNEIIIIDGQQRVTTVSLLMIAIMNAIESGDVVCSDPSLAEEIRDTYIVDKYQKSERKVRLKPFREDCQALDNLIFKRDYINNSNITINYKYFYDRILSLKEISVEQLYEAIQKLEIIHIDLEPQHGDDAQLIFESLNSTGLALTESDKIRNFILMGLSPEDQEKFYDNYWQRIENYTDNELDSFIRNYLTIKTGQIFNFGKLYFAFKDFASNEGDTEVLLKDILHYAKIFDDIKKSKLNDSESERIMNRLKQLDMTVAYPFLLSFISMYRNENWDEKELRTILATIETYIFRRQMCDYPTNALNKMFASMHRRVLKIKQNSDSNYSSIFIYIINNMQLSVTLPNDEEFKQGFTTKNIYAMHKKNRSYLFERLENMNSKEINVVADNIESNNYTVEHIMPQTLTPHWKNELGADYERIHEQWVHTIANLTLTGYNSEYSNRSFEEKKNMKDGFADSKLSMNHYIAQFDKWTLEELKMRQEKLFNDALSIWPYPQTDFDIPRETEETVYLSEDISFTFKGLKSFTLFDKTFKTKYWTDAYVKVISILHEQDPSVLYGEIKNGSSVVVSSPATSYKKISDDVYIWTGTDTNTKIHSLRDYFDKYGVSQDELAFELSTNDVDSLD